MLNWLKKHFIPHEGNNHLPHILRNKNTRNIIFIVICLEIFTFLIPTLLHINYKDGMAAVLPSILSDLTNTERNNNNLNTLEVNPILTRAAELKAQDMATLGYFAHTSPEGKTPWYWLDQVNYNYQYAGENLAVNFTDSKDVTDAWMNSPTHRANIVKDKYTEVGTGIATGVYEGRDTVFVAQIYANPALKQIQEPKITKSKTDDTSIVNNDSRNVPPVNVLGAETIKQDNLQKVPSFEANTEIVNDVIQSENLANQNIAVREITNANFIQKIFASPRNFSNIILYIIFIIISFALALYIFIKIRNHHYGLITNALIILALILAIMIGNYYISNRSMTISQSVDYSFENK